jgi:hypothetical protein
MPAKIFGWLSLQSRSEKVREVPAGGIRMIIYLPFVEKLCDHIEYLTIAPPFVAILPVVVESRSIHQGDCHLIFPRV